MPVGGPHQADGLWCADACGTRVACRPKPAWNEESGAAMRLLLVSYVTLQVCS